MIIVTGCNFIVLLITIIIGLLIFGHFFGIIGMVVATPTLTILRVIIEFTNEKLLLKKNV